jgi:Fic family protein
MSKRAKNKREQDVLEGRGLWKASSFLNNKVKSLTKKNKPLLIGYIKTSHQLLFSVANAPEMAGKYRTVFKDNGIDLRRQDGTYLKFTSWEKIPFEMELLNKELIEFTKNLKKPNDEKDYKNIVSRAAHLSHRLACIHPFKNGNGRMSRLLMNAILVRAKLSPIPFLGHLKMTKAKLKKTYYNAMYLADKGDFSQLETFIVKGIIVSQNEEIEARKKHKYK